MGNIGEDYSHLITNGAVVDQPSISYHDKPSCIYCYVFVLFINKFLFYNDIMMQTMSTLGKLCITCTWTVKRELRSKSTPVSVYTFKDNKVILVDRNEEVFFLKLLVH